MLKFAYHDNFDVSIARRTLKEIDSILKGEGCNYCLVGGTLLGFVRHGRLMPWDDDLDLLLEESFVTRFRDTNFFYKYGFWYRIWPLPQGQYYDWVLQIIRNDIQIDLWPWKPVEDNTAMGTVFGAYPKEKMLPYRDVPFETHNYCIPRDPYYVLDRNLKSTDWREKIIRRVTGHKGQSRSTERFSGPLHYQIDPESA